MKLLSPTLDVVFKMLLLSDERLLRSMIESVLRLPAPLAAVAVLNPEIPSHMPEHHGVVLDVRARLTSGEEIDLEMVTRAGHDLPSRLLYYWGRQFSSQLPRGADYRTLVPLRQIVWTVRTFLPLVARFHEIFRIVGDHTGQPFAAHLEIHVLDLSCIRSTTTSDASSALRWGRFLLLDDDRRATLLAVEDPIMSLAIEKLRELSRDPVARRIADDRERDLLALGHTIASAREQGRAEGRAEGKEEGVALGLLRSIEALAATFGVELTDARRAELAAATADELHARLTSLAATRDWV